MITSEVKSKKDGIFTVSKHSSMKPSKSVMWGIIQGIMSLSLMIVFRVSVAWWTIAKLEDFNENTSIWRTSMKVSSYSVYKMSMK